MKLKEITDGLLHRDPLPPLFPNRVWREEWRREIQSLDVNEFARAALHLANDDIGLCHEVAQVNENADGNYLHAVLHRREKDFSNSKYWLARVGGHPVWEKMQAEFPEWTPVKFVDWCESGEKPGAELERIQAHELRLLIESFLSA